MSTPVTKAQASMLRSVMEQPGWETILSMLANRIRDVQAEKIAGTNEFETLRMLHINQGRADELTDFFNYLDSEALG